MAVSLPSWLSKSDVGPCYGPVKKLVATLYIRYLQGNTGKGEQNCSLDTLRPEQLGFFLYLLVFGLNFAGKCCRCPGGVGDLHPRCSILQVNG